MERKGKQGRKQVWVGFIPGLSARGRRDEGSSGKAQSLKSLVQLPGLVPGRRKVDGQVVETREDRGAEVGRNEGTCAGEPSPEMQWQWE